MLIKTLLTIMVLVATSASAKNLYVDTNDAGCSDSTTHAANDAANPWCTIGRAAWGQAAYSTTGVSAQAAQAGDTVYVAEGIYWETGPSTGGRFVPVLSPVNDGTSTNPIIFQGVGTVQVRLNLNVRGPMIGCSGVADYIYWKNFSINDYYGGSVSDTGPVFFGGTGCRLEDSVVKGHDGSYYHGYTTFGGNYRLVGMEGAEDTEIRNNTIYQAWNGADPGGQNEAGILSYDTNNTIIENNEIYDCGQGIFLKGTHAGRTQSNNIIRYNLLYDNGGGIRALGATDSLIYQNIVHSGASSNANGLHAGFSNSARSRFVNNTVYGLGIGIIPQGVELDDVQFLNNIIVGSTTSAIHNWDVANPSNQDVSYNRNLYYDNPYIWNNQGGTNLNFAQFQAYGMEAGGLSGSDPLFTNAATFDFTLQGTSPALTLGRTITAIHGTSGQTIPAGAYITGDEIIGLLSGAAECSPQYRNLCDVSNCETTGEGYWYDDTCNAAEEPVPNNGACGSNDGGTFSSLLSSSPNNCSAGALANFSGTGPWTWSCDGSQGGTNASCSASLSDCTSSAALCTSRTDCTTNWPTYNWCINVCQEAGCPGGGFGQAPYSPTNFIRYSATSFAPFNP